MDVDKPEKSTATASPSADSKAPKRFEVKKVGLVPQHMPGQTGVRHSSSELMQRSCPHTVECSSFVDMG